MKEEKQERTLFAELDKGIDDMEQGRTFSHSDTMQMVVMRLKKDIKNWYTNPYNRIKK